tara:strand:- start:828 stop:1517 length:690 start_codon:yes stop_codon:yes gene_type:complete
MFAYIPARIGSKRIRKKNIRILDGKPLIIHVIDNLLETSEINDIAVSTDSDEVLEICSDINDVTTLDLREKKLADDKTDFMDLIINDMPRYCSYFNDKEFIFCLPTAALVQAKEYSSAIEKFYSDPQGIVMSVVGYDISPYLALEKNNNSYKPIFPEKYLEPTSVLPKTVADCGCFYILNYESALRSKKLIDIKPLNVHILNSDIGIDLDLEEDWLSLQDKYLKINNKI